MGVGEGGGGARLLRSYHWAPIYINPGEYSGILVKGGEKPLLVWKLAMWGGAHLLQSYH